MFNGGAEMAKRQLHKLSAREAETIVEPGRHSDGGGLYLAIETGTHARRQWVFLYRVRGTGKRREFGLGSAKGKGRDGISLADARLKAAEVRKQLAEGKEPGAERRAKIVAASNSNQRLERCEAAHIGILHETLIRPPAPA